MARSAFLRGSGVLEVARGEQHLSGDDLIAGEALLVAVDQQVLPDGGGGLLGGEVGRPGVETQVGHARRDGAGGHEDDLGAAAVRLGEGVTSGSIWPALSPLIDEEPTFTTTRRAVADLSA